jgi:hypothetical protein
VIRISVELPNSGLPRCRASEKSTCIRLIRARLRLMGEFLCCGVSIRRFRYSIPTPGETHSFIGEASARSRTCHEYSLDAPEFEVTAPPGGGARGNRIGDLRLVVAGCDPPAGQPTAVTCR